MKYIRTKDDKIFDLNKIKKQIKENSVYPHLHLYDWKLAPTNDLRGALELSWKEDFKGSDEKPKKFAVILNCESSEYRKAKNIEELCDYVFYYNCWKELVIRKLPLSTSLESLYKDMKDKMVSDIKLAILTDKGLIYVAKMNDKGKMALL